MFHRIFCFYTFLKRFLTQFFLKNHNITASNKHKRHVYEVSKDCLKRIWQSLLSRDRIKSGVLKFSFPVQNTTTEHILDERDTVLFRPRTDPRLFQIFLFKWGTNAQIYFTEVFQRLNGGEGWYFQFIAD